MTHHDGFGDFDLGEYERERDRRLEAEALKGRSEWQTRELESKRLAGLTPEKLAEQQRHEAAEKHRRISEATRTLSVDTPIVFYGKTPEERFPKGPVMAVIYNTQYSYDSGYGHNGATDMCTGTSTEIVYFLTEEALSEWVIKATKDRKTFKVVQITPIETEVKAVFSIKK